MAEPPEHMCCPLTMDLIVDPVVDVTTGTSYERSAILEWVERKGTSPTSGQPLTSAQLVPNLALRDAVAGWREANGYSAAVISAAPAARAVEVAAPPPGAAPAASEPIDLTAPEPIDLTASEPVDLTAASAVWEYENGTDNWRRYGAAAAEALEAGFAANPRGVLGLRVGRRAYHVDLGGMTQTNQTTGGERRLRRNSGDPPPPPPPSAGGAFWEFEERGSWQRYGADHAALATAAAATGASFCFGRSGQTYFVDTEAMTQTNVDTNVVRRLRRM